jgi:hypothetical protein
MMSKRDPGVFVFTFDKPIGGLSNEELEKVKQDGIRLAEEWAKLHPHTTSGNLDEMDGGVMAWHWGQKYSHDDSEQE